MTDYYLFCEDCRNILPSIPKNSVDLIFADPPFNISSKNMVSTPWCGYSSFKGKWDLFEGDYNLFTKKWVSECYRILRKGGSIYIIGVFGSLISAFSTLEKLGAKFQSHIIWHKTNPAPSVHRRMYTHANEIILVYSKGKNWCFNYKVSKEYNKGKQLHNVWDIPAVRKKWGVSRKPPALLERIIRISSNEGDLVLDPFLGSGTAMEECYKWKRNCIGIEKDPNVCKNLISEQKEIQLLNTNMLK